MISDIPEFVDIATLGKLFDADPKRTREMVILLGDAGFDIPVVPWGKSLTRKKYSYPAFRRSLLEFARSLAAARHI